MTETDTRTQRTRRVHFANAYSGRTACGRFIPSDNLLGPTWSEDRRAVTCEPCQVRLGIDPPTVHAAAERRIGRLRSNLAAGRVTIPGELTGPSVPAGEAGYIVDAITRPRAAVRRVDGTVTYLDAADQWLRAGAITTATFTPLEGAPTSTAPAGDTLADIASNRLEAIHAAVAYALAGDPVAGTQHLIRWWRAQGYKLPEPADVERPA